MTSVSLAGRLGNRKVSIAITITIIGAIGGYGPERTKAITNANPTTAQPWVVGLVLRKTATGKQELCTGSSLSRHWIVTSAHCLRGRSYQTDTVRVFRDVASPEPAAQTAVYSGKASFYNHPHHGHSGDRGDDIGLVRLRGEGMIPELTAKLYHGPRIEARPFFVAGFGDGTDAGGSKDCDSSSVVGGTKRIGRVVLSGITDNNGWLGWGNPIAVEAQTLNNALCHGDSGAPWAFAVGDNPDNEWHVFAIHSGDGLRLPIVGGNQEWGTLLRPKMRWVTDLAATMGMPLGCPSTGEPDQPGSYRRCTEGYWMVSSAASDATPSRFQLTSMNLATVHFGDFDGDGRKADAFVSSPNGQNYVLYANAVEWRMVTPVSPGQPLQHGDFDGDGVTDVLKQGGGHWYVIFGKPDRTTLWGNPLDVGTSDVPPNKLLVGDMDGDGVADVLRSSDGFLQVSFGTKDRTVWSRWTRLQNSQDPVFQLRVADFDGDGVSDVFRIDQHNRWQISYATRDRTAHWAQWITVNSSRTPLHLLGFGDFDGNGATDVLRSSGGEWSVSYATRDRTQWSRWVTINRSSIPVRSLSFAYVDQDRRSDAVFVAPVVP